MTTVTNRFAALGTTVEGGFRAEERDGAMLWNVVKEKVTLFEQKFSRFIPTSELSVLNAHAGTPIKVSLAMLAMLDAARRAFDTTGGLVDPTVGGALMAVGYDGPFDSLRDRPESSKSGTSPLASFDMVHIDQERLVVTVPVGVTLDFGGIGKGYLLDMLRPDIEACTSDYWLSLGGDLIVAGTDEQGNAWQIGVQDPSALDQDLGALALPEGRWGVATSGTTKRRGVVAGIPWHHLIDPHTGAPSMTNIAHATVIALTALDADVAAKRVLLGGFDEGIVWARLHGYDAVVITTDGQLITTTNSLLRSKVTV